MQLTCRRVFPILIRLQSFLRVSKRSQKDPSPRYHQYSITWGARLCARHLPKKQSRYMGIPVDPDENIVVTCGSTEAMMAAMMTVTIRAIKWLSLIPSTKTTVPIRFFRAQSLSIFLPLQSTQFRFWSTGARTPSVKTGQRLLFFATLQIRAEKCLRAKLDFIASLCKKYDAYCITDEVYEHIVNAPCRHTYMASLPGCSSAPLAALLCPRRTRLQDGVWDTPSPRLELPSALRKCMTF